MKLIVDFNPRGNVRTVIEIDSENIYDNLTYINIYFHKKAMISR